MNKQNKLGFATRQIHAGKIENSAGSLCAPIYQSSTFEFASVEQGGARFAGQENGYIYTRLGNPTITAVEEKMASLKWLLWKTVRQPLRQPPVWAPFPLRCGVR